jgi:hypothetical protein
MHMLGRDEQSVMTIVEELSSLLNSAEEPILTVDGILVMVTVLRLDGSQWQS